jgi:hypothetical protein
MNLLLTGLILAGFVKNGQTVGPVEVFATFMTVRFVLGIVSGLWPLVLTALLASAGM